jgi:hypothetical protein
MRGAVERHISSAGNVAFFGANTCWGRVVVDEEQKTIAAPDVGSRNQWQIPEEFCTGVLQGSEGGPLGV